MAVLAAVGLGVQALSGIGSFIQAGQRQKEIDKANKAAQQAVAEAKKQIELKPYEALTVSDSPYERQREQFASQAALATQSAAEMGAAGMGRVGAIAMAGNEAQAGIRDSKIQQLENIEKLQAEDEARAAQQLSDLALQEAQGAQQAAADAQGAKADAIRAGSRQITDAAKTFTTIDPNTGQSLAEALGLGGGLYGKNKNSSPMSNRSMSVPSQPNNIMIGDQGLNTVDVQSSMTGQIDPSAMGVGANRDALGTLFGGAGTFTGR